MSTNKQMISTYRSLKEGKIFPHPDLCMCEGCLSSRNEEEYDFEQYEYKGTPMESWHRKRGCLADDPADCRCSSCLYLGEKFAYYEDLRTRFRSSVIRLEDRISQTGFNYIAAELNELLANPPRIDECMVKHIISGVEEGLNELSRRGER